jgi:OmcA/MtrC family decaheme c-type cytochrome
MTRTDSARSARLAFAVALTLASACSGDTGPKGDQGDQGDQGDGGTQGPTGPVALTAESCVVCHAAGNTADDLAAHAARKNQSLARNVATITSVTIPGAAGGGGTPTVLFSVTDSTTSAPVTGLTSFAFAIARLEPDAALGIASWKSYVNRNYATAPAISIGGTTISSTGTAAMKAACSEVTPPSGNYTCLLRTVPAGTSAFLAATVRDPASYTSTSAAVTVAYDPQYKIRVALQSGAPIPGGTVTTTPATPPFDATFDFDPAAGDTQTTPASADLRQLVKTENCNACHQKLAVHGGRRLSVPYCVTCHNPSSGDPAGTTVDFKVMVHKLHMGKDLPSVLAGGTYVIKSNFGDADFSEVSFPQEVGNCLACHGQPATVTGTPPSTTITLGTAPSLGDNYRTKPTIVTCTSCHDRTSFAASPPTGYTLHKGGTNAGVAYVDADCARCHTSGGGEPTVPIELFHAIAAAVDFKYVIVGVTGTAPGEYPAVTVKVTNAAGTTAHKLNGASADLAWSQTSTGASRLAVDIGWSITAVTSAGDTNYTNEGSGQKVGQPVSLNVLANGVDNGDGTYTVTSTVAIPANAVGAGIVALEGHPADPQGNRIAVQSVTLPFAITGTAAARRAVVDVNKCNLCHQNLSLHGNNRTSSIETCVICHNTNATDISRRPTDGTATADGKAEESVDFKRLIHGIHGASFSGAGPVIYGFGSSANDFSKAGYPGYLYNCEACHNAGTYSSTSFVPENGTTTSTSGDPLTPAGFLRTTKITAACSSCHASVPDRGHMEANGGALGVTQAQIDAVNQ